MKLNPNEEHPLDILIYKVTTPLLPIMYATNHSANTITSYSFFFGLLSLYSLWTGYVGLFVVFYLISYVFDCMDGQFAREYNMTTRFGDFYDHTTDMIVYIGIAVVVFQKKKRPMTNTVLLILILTVSMVIMSIGCQQRRKPAHIGPETLDLAMKTCGDANWIQWTRFTGPTLRELLSTYLQ